MIQIRQILAEEAWPVRHQVMWPEEPFNYVILDDDMSGVHFGLFIEGLLISVVSLFQEEDLGQFRKFATLELYQGKGFGTMLLQHLVEQANKLGIKKIWANARVEKMRYYKRLGFIPTDQTFVKNGQAYVIIEQYI